MESIREHCLTHYCLVSLNSGDIYIDDTIEVLATAGEHMNYETTVEEHLIETLLPFTSAVSMQAEKEWKQAWEAFGADSGYAAYIPTPAENFNWQNAENMALRLGIGEQILLEFLVNNLELHDFTLEWEDETDEHCRNFLLISPE